MLEKLNIALNNSVTFFCKLFFVWLCLCNGSLPLEVLDCKPFSTDINKQFFLTVKKASVVTFFT